MNLQQSPLYIFIDQLLLFLLRHHAAPRADTSTAALAAAVTCQELAMPVQCLSCSPQTFLRALRIVLLHCATHAFVRATFEHNAKLAKFVRICHDLSVESDAQAASSVWLGERRGYFFLFTLFLQCKLSFSNILQKKITSKIFFISAFKSSWCLRLAFNSSFK